MSSYSCQEVDYCIDCQTNFNKKLVEHEEKWYLVLITTWVMVVGMSCIFYLLV
jgi:hypothetical protein